MAQQREPNIDVLVAGGGPTGLTMGIQLARCGLSYRIVDTAAAPAKTSRALAIQPRTLEFFETMGVVDDVLARGLRLKRMNFYVGARRIGGITNAMITDSRYSSVVILEQNETEAILRARLENLGGQTEWGVALTTFAQDAAGVTATLRHAGGGEETVRARWLVGCDGAHSAVRHGLGVSFQGDAYHSVYWLADGHIRWDFPRDEIHGFFGARGALLIFPLPGAARYRVFVLWNQPEDVATEGLTVADLQAAIDDFCPSGITLTDAEWISAFRLHHRIVTRYQDGRVFLAGDAAHIHSPAGGQGMNTGIQDADNLAWKLALARAGKARPGLLASYDAERSQVGEQVLKQTDRPFRIVTASQPPLMWVRDHLASRLISNRRVGQWFLRNASELAIRYTRSPIVEQDTRARGIPAGYRAPDATLVDAHTGDATRLFALCQANGPTRHTLVLLSSAMPTAAEMGTLMEIACMVRARYDEEIAVVPVIPEGSMPPDSAWDGARYCDRDGAMRARYGATRPALFLIRPDGYVGCRSQPADAAHSGRISARSLSEEADEYEAA